MNTFYAKKVSLYPSSFFHLLQNNLFFPLTDMLKFLSLWLDKRIAMLLCILIIFHTSEFITHFRLHPKSTNLNSFLISRDSAIITVLSFVEYFFRKRYYPQYDKQIFQAIGFSLMAFGFAIHRVAIKSLGRSYTHYIAIKRDPGADLVTKDIYKYMRHPSYFGLFLFQIGNQVFLGNVIFSIIYAFVLLRFYHKRIIIEEKYLVRIYGARYLSYLSKVKFAFPLLGDSIHVP